MPTRPNFSTARPSLTGMLLAAAALTALATTARAQEPAPGVSPTTPQSLARPAATEDSDALRLTFSLEGTHQFRTDLRTDTGEYQVSRLNSGTGLSYRLNPSITLSLDTSSEVSWYEFKNATTLLSPPPGAASSAKPFHVMYSTSINPGIRYGIDEHWFVLGGGILQVAGDRHADIFDSISGGGFVAGGYRFSDDLTIYGGLLAKSELEDDALVVPLIGVNWKITDQLRLDTRGLGFILSFQLAPTVRTFIDGTYESRTYRLSDDNFLPEGIIRDRQIPIALGVAWKPLPTLEFTGRLGVIAWQEFTIDDKNGNRINRFRSDPTPFVGLRAEFSF
ncbi:hypothetical protein BH11PLA1_BH11PLA1_10310 [soil metagenome]